MNPLIQFKKTIPLFVVSLGLACFVLLPAAQAGLSPTPDGLYPGANVAEGGSGALFSLTTGTNNTAVGNQALFSLTTGVQNTAVGAQALKNSVGDRNTAVGFQALGFNAGGGDNTASGWRALFKNSTGDGNTAVGFSALYSNTTGDNNTASGLNALLNNTTASGNTAIGTQALQANTTGGLNTAVGAATLFLNTTGTDNTGIGLNALFSNVDGSFNTAVGRAAMGGNIAGNNNTAVGWFALSANTSGSGNIALGNDAGSGLTTGDLNIDIGAPGGAGEAATIRIGSIQTAAFVAGISGEDAIGGDPVFVKTNGKLGTNNMPSSARFKEEIKPMNDASDVILALKPVTFRYKKEFDPTRIPQFGLVAEEVEKVNPDLVKRDRDGKLETVRYEAVNAMLLNEFLKEHKTVGEQQATIADLKVNAARQQKQIDALIAGLQKVSAQLEVSKAAPQTVLNNR